MADTVNLSNEIITLAVKLRKKLGPGLYEKTYLRCLAYELEKMGYNIKEDINLKPTDLNVHRRQENIIDILVENKLIIDLRSVDKLMPHHEVELLTTLRAANKDVGLLINFNQPKLHEGIKKIKLY